MPDVQETIELSVAPEVVWDICGHPQSTPTWVPAVRQCRMKGDVRYSTLSDGSEAVERILLHSDQDRECEYELVDPSPPIRSYWSRLTVEPLPTGTILRWCARFETTNPEDTEAIGASIRATYRGGLETLAEQVDKMGHA